MNASEADIQHFLVTYDVSDGSVSIREFGPDYEAAVAAYGELEEELRDDSKFEVVLLSADSIETLKRTHSSYFGTEPAFEHLLPKGVLT
ncbi:MAG: hypothetical protein WAO61_09800 [Solirubrobacterales bacterium]